MEIKRNLNPPVGVNSSHDCQVSISYGDKEKFEHLFTLLMTGFTTYVSISYGDKEKFEQKNIKNWSWTIGFQSPMEIKRNLNVESGTVIEL